MGLGNPGPKYANTLHNLGFRVLDQFVQRFSVDSEKRDSAYVLTTVEFADRQRLACSKAADVYEPQW